MPRFRVQPSLWGQLFVAEAILQNGDITIAATLQLDTGSTTCLISPETAKLLSIQETETKKTKIMTANGTIESELFRVDYIIDNQLYKNVETGIIKLNSKHPIVGGFIGTNIFKHGDVIQL